MRLEVIICEDERAARDLLRAHISRWAASKAVDVRFIPFSDPKLLLASHAVLAGANALFLDISFAEGEMDGMELAARIRQMGYKIPIIFESINTQRASYGYVVNALGFLDKPLSYRRLALFMDRLLRKASGASGISIQHGGRVYSIPKNDIAYVESNGHNVVFHISNAPPLDARGTLAEELCKLGDGCFVQISRYFIVSIEKISSIKATYPYSVDIVVGGDVKTLNVGRSYVKVLVSAFAEYLEGTAE